MTTVAVQLMAANAATSAMVSQEVLAVLVDYFDVDFSFLRYNDHDIRASILIAEWPVRPDVPDPDPLKIVYYADADPVFAVAEHIKMPTVFRPDNADYQKRIEEGRNIPQTSMAAAPLVSGDLTTGVLGFVKVGDREWKPEELNALEAIASLFAQVQARVTGGGAPALPRRTRRSHRPAESACAHRSSRRQACPGQHRPGVRPVPGSRSPQDHQ